MNYPRILAALPCEDASVSAGIGDNRVTIMRVFFDVYADKFPAAFSKFVVCVLWIGGEGEHTSTISIKDPDGNTLATGQTTVTCQPEPTTFAQIVYFPRLIFTKPGKHTVEISLNGTPIHTFPIHVIQVGGEKK
jgi:hypothetical protein